PSDPCRRNVFSLFSPQHGPHKFVAGSHSRHGIRPAILSQGQRRDMTGMSHLRSLYLLAPFRKIVVRIRLFYFVRIRRSLKTIKSADAFEMTIPHNMKSLGQCNPRIDLLIKPLSVMESLNESAKVLIVGPRDEHDLFTLIGHGFSKDRIRGLDLISYSPMID